MTGPQKVSTSRLSFERFDARDVFPAGPDAGAPIPPLFDARTPVLFCRGRKASDEGGDGVHVIILQLFVGIVLFARAPLLLACSARQNDVDHADRPSLLPLEEYAGETRRDRT